MLVLLIILIFSLSFKRNIEKNPIMIEKINIMEMKVNETVLKDKTVKEYLTDKTSDIGLPVDITKILLENDIYKQLLEKYLIIYSDYLLYLAEKPYISSEKVNKIINENILIIEKESNSTLDNNTKEKISNLVNELCENIKNTIPALNKENTMFNVLHMLISKKMQISLILCIIISVLLICILNKSFIVSLIYNGLCFILVAIFYILTSVVGKYVIISGNNLKSEFINIFIVNMAKSFLNYGLILLAFGLFFITAFVSLKRFIIKNEHINI